MFLFNYSIEVKPEQVKSIQVTCQIEYIDPDFEERVKNILKNKSIFIDIDEEINWLTKLTKDQIELTIYLNNDYMPPLVKDVTEEFINKKIVLQIKYDQNIERFKHLFEKKINRLFRKEIKHFYDVKHLK